MTTQSFIKIRDIWYGGKYDIKNWTCACWDGASAPNECNSLVYIWYMFISFVIWHVLTHISQTNIQQNTFTLCKYTFLWTHFHHATRWHQTSIIHMWLCVCVFVLWQKPDITFLWYHMTFSKNVLNNHNQCLLGKSKCPIFGIINWLCQYMSLNIHHSYMLINYIVTL